MTKLEKGSLILKYENGREVGLIAEKKSTYLNKKIIRNWDKCRQVHRFDGREFSSDCIYLLFVVEGDTLS